jgi:hypothetical protein
MAVFWLFPGHAWTLIFVIAAGMTALYSLMPRSGTWGRRKGSVMGAGAIENPGA